MNTTQGEDAETPSSQFNSTVTLQDRKSSLLYKAKILAGDIGSRTEALDCIREAAALAPGDSEVASALREFENASKLGYDISANDFITETINRTDINYLKYLRNKSIRERFLAEGIAERIREKLKSDSHRQRAIELMKAFSVLESKILDQFSQNLNADDICLLATVETGIELFPDLAEKIKDWPSPDHRSDILKSIIATLSGLLPNVEDNKKKKILHSLARLIAQFDITVHLAKDHVWSILICLDRRKPEQIKSLATIVIAKLVEKLKQTDRTSLCVSFFSDYFSSAWNERDAESMVTVLSSFTVLFQIDMQIASNIYEHEKLLENANDLLLNPNIQVKRAALDLYRNAVSQARLRAEFSSRSTPLLQSLQEDSDPEIRISTCVLIIKAYQGLKGSDNPFSMDELASRLQFSITKDGPFYRLAIEGLAFASADPLLKDLVSKDQSFLAALVELIKLHPADGPMVLGALTIFSNISRYSVKKTEEEQQVERLRKAALRKNFEMELLPESDAQVKQRCLHVLHAGIVPVLGLILKNFSPTFRHLVAEILHSLSSTPENRGPLVQQGVLKTLVKLLGQKQNKEENDLRVITSQTIAKIHISLSPRITNSSCPAETAIKCLADLLNNNELSQIVHFESLVALTNLASEDDNNRDSIAEQTWSQIEMMLLNDNHMIQRASAELICNLVVSHSIAVTKYIDGSSTSNNRLKLLLVLTDVEDYPTRRAVGGILGTLTGYEAICDSIVDQNLDAILRPFDDKADEMLLRGFVCLLNIICNTTKEKDLFSFLTTTASSSKILKASQSTKNEGVLQVVGKVTKELKRRKIIQ
ncbi:Ring assembly protein 3 [Neolecta irregularis DAH-3]|uniref:Ring assembly protein 3 n=1 Tax=Neolecta irregularis (strain DAH-3) TaxID=1198029 RepID=A0A1U7LWP0_NEOID|nr:Ring assembly protein 3 [Neolecta irregularis DAH-3]|eukprot:OLL27087.1 Ring assembly protein 3 [Neolecta irregularis DAH-3]